MTDRRIVWMAFLVLVGACGGSGSVTTPPPPPGTPPPPPPPPPGVASIAVVSGDAQITNIGTPLYAPLKIVVTRSGVPLADQAVLWQAANGSVSPAQTTTGSDGTSMSFWTLGNTLSAQTARAYVGTTSGAYVTFNALGATFGSGAQVEIDMYYGGGARFEPAAIIIAVGTTVTWVWKDGTHSVQSDSTPIFPGSIVYGAPRSYPVTFLVSGTYRYHCSEHGYPGSGMYGVVIVQ